MLLCGSLPDQNHRWRPEQLSATLRSQSSKNHYDIRMAFFFAVQNIRPDSRGIHLVITTLICYISNELNIKALHQCFAARFIVFRFLSRSCTLSLAPSLYPPFSSIPILSSWIHVDFVLLYIQVWMQYESLLSWILLFNLVIGLNRRPWSSLGAMYLR